MVSLDEYLKNFPEEQWDEIAARWNKDTDGLSIAEYREGEEYDEEIDDLLDEYDDYDDDDYDDDPSESVSAGFILTDEGGGHIVDLQGDINQALQNAIHETVDFSDSDIMGYAVTDMRFPKKIAGRKTVWGDVVFALEVAHAVGWTVYFIVEVSQ